MWKRAAARNFDEHWKENEQTGCHEWQLHLDRQGYGRLRDGARRVSAHRFSYERAYGLIPSNKVVCHRCDNPRCVNPAHLFIGAPVENTRDAMAKGRMARGEKVGGSKLTTIDAERARDLARSGVPQVEIAKHLNISQPTVSKIVLRKTWRHVA